MVVQTLRSCAVVSMITSFRVVQAARVFGLELSRRRSLDAPEKLTAPVEVNPVRPEATPRPVIPQVLELIAT